MVTLWVEHILFQDHGELCLTNEDLLYHLLCNLHRVINIPNQGALCF